MKSSTRKLSLTALFSALSLVLLYLGGVLETFGPSLAMLASILTVAAVIEGGVFYGTLCYLSTGILGFFIAPGRSAVWIYILFFGYYPVIKSLIERFRKFLLEWIIKLAFVNAILTVYLIALRELLFMDTASTIFEFIPLGYLLINIVFVMYDYAMSASAKFYIGRISKYK